MGVTAMPAIPESETERNFAAFIGQLPDLLEKFCGQFALIHGQKIEGYFPSALDAMAEGHEKFGEGAYSVQEVTDEIENLGFYSYAGGAGQA